MKILSNLIMHLLLYFATRRYDDRIIKVIHYKIKMLTSTTVTRAVYIISMSFKKNNINRTKCLKQTQADGWLGSLCNQTESLLSKKKKKTNDWRTNISQNPQRLRDTVRRFAVLAVRDKCVLFYTCQQFY